MLDYTSFRNAVFEILYPSLDLKFLCRWCKSCRGTVKIYFSFTSL